MTMNHEALNDLLAAVRDGKASVEDAAGQLRQWRREPAFADLGHAKVDLDRHARQGSIITGKHLSGRKLSKRLKRQPGKAGSTQLQKFPAGYANILHTGIIPKPSTGQ